MKILQILPALGQGGVERGTIEIAAALSRAGIPNGVVSSGGVMVNDLEKMGVAHYTLPVQSKNPFVVYRNAKAISKIVKENGYTLMHVRSRAPAWSVYKASKKTRVPMLATYHGIYGTSPRWLKIPYNRVMLKGVKVIAVSDWVRRHIMDVYGVEDSFIELIHRGADLNKFKYGSVSDEEVKLFKEKYSIPSGMPVITLPGRLTSLKGQDILLKALKVMRNKNVCCVFAGSDQGRVEYSAYLHSLAKELPEETKCVFIDNVREMPSLYVASDVVVSANSSKPESFGRTIPEAQAMGTITVATRHGGACETIEDGVTGFLVTPGSVDELARKIDDVLEMSFEDREEMSKKSVESVKRNFSTQKMCESTIELYKRLHEGK